MHVRSPLASFWRGFTLDGYDGHGWVSATSAVRLAVDPAGRLMFLEAPSAMRRDRAYVQSYFLKLPQPNALFTAYNPGWIALGAGGTTGRLQLAQGNLEYLRTVYVNEVAELRFWEPGQQTSRFGMGNARGVIEVILRP